MASPMRAIRTQAHAPEEWQPGDELRLAAPAGRHAIAASVIALAAATGLAVWEARQQAHGPAPAGVWPAVAVLAAAGLAALRGLTQVAPGEAVLVQLFGRYLGSIREPGLHWVIPWAGRRRIPVRLRSYETPVSKVNDADGNPVEIAVVAVWQVADTARAVFAVDDVTAFVATQAEIAARQTASSYPYDDHGTGRPCLRASAAEISAILAADIAERVSPAGVRILETRISRLSYAPEIAHAMLRRQQAEAVVAARQRIVDGAVGMVESALARLAADGVVDFDEERKAAMVSNMLVVLCSDQATQPVVNTGTIYQ
ncbi:MAG: SPFH domain-containing protein [Gemmatimonadota bacterium]